MVSVKRVSYAKKDVDVLLVRHDAMCDQSYRAVVVELLNIARGDAEDRSVRHDFFPDVVGDYWRED